MLNPKGISLGILSLLLIFAGCPSESSGEWLIPEDQVYEGGPGKDGIPALENPEFISVSEVDFLSDDDLVIGVKMGDDIRSYPHPILNWHEIINDDINDTYFSITYCPLTGSGIGWSRTLNGQTTTFGVSGLLYNSNLIPYDRLTDSNWSQMMLQCVNGELIGQYIETAHVIETTWQTWKEMYPESEVVSTNTGYDRPYETYPYGDYKTNHETLIFPISNDDPRLPRKERVHGVIIGNETKVYVINSFPDTIHTINDNFNDVPLVVVGSSSKNFVVTYKRELADGTILTFEPVQDALPVVMIDNEGTTWNIFGEAVEGPRQGARLNPTLSFNSYWFAWGTFYPGAEIYSH